MKGNTLTFSKVYMKNIFAQSFFSTLVSDFDGHPSAELVKMAFKSPFVCEVFIKQVSKI